MAHYRDTYRYAKFVFLDYRAGVVILASLLHIRLWTGLLDVVVILLALYVDRIGLGLTGAVRAARSYLAGSYRPALRREKIRRKVDFERRLMAWEKRPDTSPAMLAEVRSGDADKDTKKGIL